MQIYTKIKQKHTVFVWLYRKFVLMSIYSLKQGYYLYHDVEFVLDQISEFYKVDIKAGKATVVSIIELDKKNHFASKESSDRFNTLSNHLFEPSKLNWSLIHFE